MAQSLWKLLYDISKTLYAKLIQIIALPLQWCFSWKIEIESPCTSRNTFIIRDSHFRINKIICLCCQQGQRRSISLEAFIYLFLSSIVLRNQLLVEERIFWMLLRWLDRNEYSMAFIRGIWISFSGILSPNSKMFATKWPVSIWRLFIPQGVEWPFLWLLSIGTLCCLVISLIIKVLMSTYH